MSTESSAQDSGFTISDDTGNRVFLRKINTRKGERLEIDSPRVGASSRLDAVALESLTWQKKEVFDELQPLPANPNGRKGSLAAIEEEAEELRIANEFAEVFVSKEGGPSEQAYISSRRLDNSISLTVRELEALSCQDPNIYSEFLVYPFGPEH